MDQSIQVTGGAIRQLFGRDARFGVALRDAFLRVIMAGITIELSVIHGMAGLTGLLAFPAMVEGKDMRVKQSGLPCIRGVAVLAFDTHCAGMDLWILVAGGTFGGCAMKFLFHMTGLALQHSVCSGEGKHIFMFETLHAIYTVMTLQAVGAENRGVRVHEGLVFSSMASDAALWVHLVAAGGVAGGTGKRRVVKIQTVAVQGKSRSGMVEGFSAHGRREPALGGVAGRAVFGKKPGMDFRFLVARGALRHNGVEFAVAVALATIRLRMRAGQRKSRAVVIKVIECGFQRIEVAALVLTVAGCTGFGIDQAPVGAVALSDLVGNLGVAGQAPVRKIALERLVTQAALRFEIGMRLEPLDFDARLALRRDRTRAEGFAPADQDH